MIFENSKHYCLRIQGTSQPLNGKEKLKKFRRISIKYSYPLSFDNPIVKTYSSINGFTRLRLVTLIRKAYKDFYSKPAKYGVWGHSKSDLVIEKLRHIRGSHFVLDIGS